MLAKEHPEFVFTLKQEGRTSSREYAPEVYEALDEGDIDLAAARFLERIEGEMAQVEA